MKITYQDGVDPAYTSDEPYNTKCIYCGAKLVFEKIKKASNYSFRDFKRQFQAEKIVLLEINEPIDELPPGYFDLERRDFGYDQTELGRCLVCGWWRILEEYTVVKDNLWSVFFELAGAIKSFEPTDLMVPLEEVRSHLVKKYQDRFRVHPRIFEMVVASVFKNLGYDSFCTAYSNDGGIDIVLSGKGQPLAVQVKRSKNNIKVEQIRSFLGALVINRFTKGIYVAASDYQAGCSAVANCYGIELINGNRFFDALKDAQVIQNNDKPEIDYASMRKLYFARAYPLNSM